MVSQGAQWVNCDIDICVSHVSALAAAAASTNIFYDILRLTSYSARGNKWSWAICQLSEYFWHHVGGIQAILWFQIFFNHEDLQYLLLCCCNFLSWTMQCMTRRKMVDSSCCRPGLLAELRLGCG